MWDDELVDELARRLTHAEREVKRLRGENRYLKNAICTTSAGRLYMWLQTCAKGASKITIHPDTIAAALDLTSETIRHQVSDLCEFGLIEKTLQPNGFYVIVLCDPR